jgi:hypothetical protein
MMEFRKQVLKEQKPDLEIIDSGTKSSVAKAMTEEVFDGYLNEDYTSKASGWTRAINK